MNKHLFITLLAFITLGLLIIAGAMLVKNYGWLITSSSLFALLFLFFIIRLIKKKLRFASLLKKYGDEELVNKIIKRTMWQRQAAEQVVDALSKFKDIYQKVLKTKAIWKYFTSGSRRYGLRITLDNGEVIGWDEKL